MSEGLESQRIFALLPVEKANQQFKLNVSAKVG